MRPVPIFVASLKDGESQDSHELLGLSHFTSFVFEPVAMRRPPTVGVLVAGFALHALNDAVATPLGQDAAHVAGAVRVLVELVERPSDVEGGTPGTAFLGVGSGPMYDDAPIGLGPALVQAPGEMLRFTGESLGALAGFFSPDGLGDFASNVNHAQADAERDASAEPAPAREGEDNRLVSIYGVVRMGADLWEEGGAFVLLLLFFQINLFIGIFNMLPLPPLDGGHAAVAIYERLRSRRGLRYHADVAKLLPVTYAVVMGLVLLGATSLYLDIVNPVNL